MKQLQQSPTGSAADGKPVMKALDDQQVSRRRTSTVESEWLYEGRRKRKEEPQKMKHRPQSPPGSAAMEFPWRRRWMMNSWAGRQRVLDDDGFEGGRGRERVHEGRKRWRKEESRVTEKTEVETPIRSAAEIETPSFKSLDDGQGGDDDDDGRRRRRRISLFLFSLCQFVFGFVPLVYLSTKKILYSDSALFFSSLFVSSCRF